MSVTITPIENDEQWHALRQRVIGASEAAALVGVHEYLTYYGLWARKSGKLPAPEDNAAMERGRRLEPIAIDVIRERFPDLSVMVPRAHYADHEVCVGATPDLFASDPERGRGVIQIKSVAPSVFRQAWRGEADLATPPVWIVIQALIEAELTGASWAAIAALVIDHEIDLHMIPVPMHHDIVETIKLEAIEFWKKVISGRAPDPDFARDGEVIRQLYKTEDGSEIDLTGNNELPALLDQRERAQEIMKRAEEEVKKYNAVLMHELGHASIGRIADGYISLKTVNRAGFEVKPTSYRQLRVVRKEAP
jgi:predicted phage-related endonuclease